MPSPFRFAGIMIVILAVCGSARAQEMAPKGSGVSINRAVFASGSGQTVKYYVKGGSPRLQALVRRIEWVENELTVVQQLQGLKLDTVVNERRIAAFRTAQLTSPYATPGFFPPPNAIDYSGDGGSHLQRALTGQLAYAATPEAAMGLIGFLEQLQTDLDRELKALPPQEQKAAQGAIDALRPKLAALPRPAVSPPRPQPVVTQQVSLPAPAVPQQVPWTQDQEAFRQTVLQNQERMRRQLAQIGLRLRPGY